MLWMKNNLKIFTMQWKMLQFDRWFTCLYATILETHNFVFPHVTQDICSNFIYN